MTKRKLKKIRVISILGVKHSIRYIKPKDGENGYYSEGLLEINKDISEPQEYLKTLLHESLHGVLQISGVHQDISLPQEHAIIDSTIAFLLTNFDIELKRK